MPSVQYIFHMNKSAYMEKKEQKERCSSVMLNWFCLNLEFTDKGKKALARKENKELC